MVRIKKESTVKLHKEALKMQMKIRPLEARGFRGGKTRALRWQPTMFQATELRLTESVTFPGHSALVAKLNSLSSPNMMVLNIQWDSKHF